LLLNPEIFSQQSNVISECFFFFSSLSQFIVVILIYSMQCSSNSFTDNARQNAMNLFLGRFQPAQSSTHIWDIESDWPMHNKRRYVEHHLLALETWWRAPLAAHRASLRALCDAPSPHAPYLHAQHSATAALRGEARCDARPPRVSDAAWAEWYGTTSLSSFDAILSRTYAWPLRHFAELDFERAVAPHRATQRSSSSGENSGGVGGGGGGAGAGGRSPNVLSSQLSGIKKFIPFGRRRPAERRAPSGGKTGRWRAAGDVPPLWRALLGETQPLPPRYHYTLRLYSVALVERADAQLVYAAALAEAGRLASSAGNVSVSVARAGRQRQTLLFARAYLKSVDRAPPRTSAASQRIAVAHDSSRDTTSTSASSSSSSSSTAVANLTEPPAVSTAVATSNKRQQQRARRRAFAPQQSELTFYETYVARFGPGDSLLAPPPPLPPSSYNNNNNDDNDDDVRLLPAPIMRAAHQISSHDRQLYEDAAQQRGII
jgi:uncharacterized membrane protein YgcG